MPTLRCGGVETKLEYQELCWSSSSVENVKNHIFNQGSKLQCWVCHWQIGSIIDRFKSVKVFGYDGNWIWTCAWKQKCSQMSGLQLFCWAILHFVNRNITKIDSNSQVWWSLTENSLNLIYSGRILDNLEAEFEEVPERKSLDKC